MATRLTNSSLGQLLLDLGFEKGDVTKTHHRVWRHAESGCELLLPANKATDGPRPQDVVGIRAQLALQGHLDEEDFDFFAREGKLPVRPSIPPG